MPTTPGHSSNPGSFNTFPRICRQRQERRPAAVALLQKANGALRILLAYRPRCSAWPGPRPSQSPPHIRAGTLIRRETGPWIPGRVPCLASFITSLDALGKALQIAFQIFQQAGPAGAFLGVQMQFFHSASWRLPLRWRRELQPHLISLAPCLASAWMRLIRIGQHLGKSPHRSVLTFLRRSRFSANVSFRCLHPQLDFRDGRCGGHGGQLFAGWIP